MTSDGRWTRAFFELWLRLTSVAGVSVSIVARTEGLHLIEQSQVVANDVLILCWEYELWFILGTPPSITERGF